MEGFILLHRKLIDWEWYDHIPTKVLFIHCLLKANHKKANWRGQEIDRGQFISSIKNLSNETGLSQKQVRTSIENLVSTNELGKQSTSLNTTLTIVNYDFYQTKGKPNGKPKANEGQSEGKRRATTNNDNNDNNENNETNKPINNKKPPKPKKVFSQDVFDCYYSILPHFDESTKPKENQVDSWLDTIEKLNRIDGYDFNDIIHLVSKTREDTFWQSNFLSINKLRKKNKDGITYWNVFYNKFKQTNNNNSSYDINELIRRKLEDPTL